MHLLIPDVSRSAWLRVGTPGIRTVPPTRRTGAPARSQRDGIGCLPQRSFVPHPTDDRSEMHNDPEPNAPRGGRTITAPTGP
jgi:hypothetical protein